MGPQRPPNTVSIPTLRKLWKRPRLFCERAMSNGPSLGQGSMHRNRLRFALTAVATFGLITIELATCSRLV